MREYTTLSQSAFDQAVAAPLTARQASEQLLKNASFRTLRDRMLKYCAGSSEEMKQMLRAGFNQNHQDSKERDSIRVSLNNWFAEKKGIDDRTVSRNYAIEMCFILNLSIAQADEFVRDVTGEGIHYRSPDEFIAAYAIENGRSYPDYLRLRENALSRLNQLPERAANEESYTRTAAGMVREIEDDEALIAYLCEHREDFSASRNTAYAYFQDMIKVLTEEGTGASVSSLVAENLYRGIVARKGKKLSPVEKSIRSGWPEDAQLSRMKNREINVSRKVLILLYLASGGGLSTQVDPDYDFDDLDALPDDNADADFEGICTNLDAMLMECGFAPLDPRQPFDWMVLFCIATGDLFELDGRFEAVLTDLFGNETKG